MPTHSGKTPLYWAHYNYDAAMASLAVFNEESRATPAARSEALAAALQYAYGSVINAKDAGARELMQRAERLRTELEGMVNSYLTYGIVAERYATPDN